MLNGKFYRRLCINYMLFVYGAYNIQRIIYILTGAKTLPFYLILDRATSDDELYEINVHFKPR